MKNIEHCEPLPHVQEKITLTSIPIGRAWKIRTSTMAYFQGPELLIYQNWLVVSTCFNPSETYESQLGYVGIIVPKKKEKNMFQAANHPPDPVFPLVLLCSNVVIKEVMVLT